MSSAHDSAECAEHHDLVRDFGGDRPRIVVLCGSTRFYEEFRRQNLRLTLASVIVLSIGCDTRADGDLFGADGAGEVDELKARLGALHLRKIDLADEVLVLNVGGYVGESTNREIAYATRIGKPVEYLHPVREEARNAIS
ncbi:hypothetical protein SAMN05421678_107129 [Actinopolymorpha cephalotaxi]|uniref:Uncharacterized protein n=1 Tax=Actinopolymorpha cephalotaxi TaxID=504797 RepID=A0A1I2TGT2_9ACTN|nr:hypothetical protein [Actinopolymorpha cephalotaxi]NYH83023.1 hypothetical protein [Actinopolymorpha cephalotaxi]SFG62567.1 hypothetical protein SAMN05421678_107129 [Actinopolymorpha cephalotaxi]